MTEVASLAAFDQDAKLQRIQEARLGSAAIARLEHAPALEAAAAQEQFVHAQQWPE